MAVTNSGLNFFTTVSAMTTPDFVHGKVSQPLETMGQQLLKAANIRPDSPNKKAFEIIDKCQNQIKEILAAPKLEVNRNEADDVKHEPEKHEGPSFF